MALIKELYRNSGLIILYSVFHEICWIICDQQSQTVDRSAIDGQTQILANARGHSAGF